MPDLDAINRYLQHRLQEENLVEVAAVPAAEWLDQEGLLKDRKERPGAPLRVLLCSGLISGQHQEANSRWYIRALS